MFIQRSIQAKIEESLAGNTLNHRIIILYGARQVGKTTLVKMILKKYKSNGVYYNCDYPDVQEAFSYKSLGQIAQMVKGVKLLVLDEAQRIKNVGLVLKVLCDEYPEVQVLATGSSSFDLANEVNEPLTGRKQIFTLFPLSFQEITYGLNHIEKKRVLPTLLQYGSYPAIYTSPVTSVEERLRELSGSYLFKDVFNFQDLRKPDILLNLLQLLAHQIGHEVSYTELSNRLGIDQVSVQRYLKLLEEAFIIFKLPALKRNMRNEVGKTRKVFFWDLGLRNILIRNTNSLEIRNDLGQLWENFCIVERIKYTQNNNYVFPNRYFWRTYEQKEIDLVEENDGLFSVYEFKWSLKKTKPVPLDFKIAYGVDNMEYITPENFMDFVSK